MEFNNNLKEIFNIKKKQSKILIEFKESVWKIFKTLTNTEIEKFYKDITNACIYGAEIEFDVPCQEPVSKEDGMVWLFVKTLKEEFESANDNRDIIKKKLKEVNDALKKNNK